jgi:hypothetical protein
MAVRNASLGTRWMMILRTEALVVGYEVSWCSEKHGN